MATMASAARDINATSARDNLTAVAARSVPVTRSHPLPLPTPPNSISPALPPHGLAAQLQKEKLGSIDSDLDIRDGHPHGSDTDSGFGSPTLDSTGALTPAMLARYHLPDILLNHGPLAIRHIMGYLTTSVPGFAGIPPAKARRLVVGALEGRGSGGEGGGIQGDVEFEKVGWGRWDARRRGQPSRGLAGPSPSLDSPYLSGIPIVRGGGAPWSNERARPGGRASSAGHSLAFSHDDRDVYMLDNEADKMSMDDGSASASCSPAPDDCGDVIMNDDPEDLTDEEDWAAVGAAALRAASYSKSAAARSSNPFLSGRGARGGPGTARAPQIDFSALGATKPDAQEREAVEALLQLGSV